MEADPWLTLNEYKSCSAYIMRCSGSTVIPATQPERQNHAGVPCKYCESLFVTWQDCLIMLAVTDSKIGNTFLMALLAQVCIIIYYLMINILHGWEHISGGNNETNRHKLFYYNIINNLFVRKKGEIIENYNIIDNLLIRKTVKS